jgi:hypothetical protein
MQRIVVAMGCAALLAACGGDERGGAAVAVRDSAGVRIVENRGLDEAAPLGWRVGGAPEIDVGAEAEPVLSQVTGACRRPDGAIVVASSGTQRLEVFGGDGRHLRSIGRGGEGPGEFRSIFHLACLPGDTVAAWDPLLGRLSVFGPDGGYARGTTPGPLGSPFPRVHGVVPGGRFVVAAEGGGVPAAGKVARDTAEWLLIGAAGAREASLGRFPGTEQIAHSDAAGMLIRPLPFGLATAAAVHGGALYVATGERYEVRIHDMDGAPRSIIRGDRARPPVTGDDVRAYRRAVVTFGGDAQARAREEALLDGAPYPREMPAIDALQVDEEGNVWVQEPGRPGADGPRRWTVFDPDGAARGTVELPSELRVMQIGRDWMLGLALDDDAAERVRLYRLDRSGA